MRHVGTHSIAMLAIAAALALPGAADARGTPRPAPYKVRIESVMAHENFLAGDALRGRGSATGDEAIAAAYVASQFAQFGLKPAPGMSGYLQPARITRLKAGAPAQLSHQGKKLEGFSLIVGSGQSVRGAIAVMTSDNPADLPAAPIVIIASPKAPLFQILGAARAKKVALLIAAENAQTKAQLASQGQQPRLPTLLEGAPPPTGISVGTLPAQAIAALAAAPGSEIALDYPSILREEQITTNAIGYIPGTDPQAGTLLFSAHLDHLGVLPNGTVMHGANDDASGTVAVIEIARAMAAGKRPRRSLLFVAYGSEEIGLYGSRYFGEHPPVPLGDIVANLEFEMIGAQDPKLPKGVMMMTGYERSDFGPAIRRHGARVTKDPYPDQRFFERSDNYSLAQRGIVAHTVSGWALVPTYHKPTDTVENIDFTFMTGAIQSLIEPVRWLANGRFTPRWTKDGRPAPR